MTKRLTRPSALAAVSCLALSIFAFSPAFAEGLKIGFSQVTLQSPFYVQLKDGAEAAATAGGDTLVFLDANGDVSKQNDDIQDLITQGVNAIIINPVNPDAVVPSLEAAAAAGIPVITVDRSVNAGAVKAHIGRDNKAMGKMAGEAVVARLKADGVEGAKIIEIQGDAGGSVMMDRRDGFHAALEGSGHSIVEGPYAEWVVVPVSNLLKAPEGTDPRAVAMVDPASIALHAIWKAGGVRMGTRGAVIGCGPIGLFAIQWMLLMGATEVIAIDVSEEKLAQARQAGATHCFLAGADLPKGLLADLIVEAAGHPTSINAAVTLAAPGGHVVFIGIPVGDVPLQNKAFQHFLRQEVSLHGSWNSFGAPYPGPQWTVTLDKLASGALHWEFMISHELPLEELPAMFDRLRNEKGMFFSKIMFRP